MENTTFTCRRSYNSFPQKNALNDPKHLGYDWQGLLQVWVMLRLSDELNKHPA